MSELADAPTDMPSDEPEEKEVRALEKRLKTDGPDAKKDHIRRYVFETRHQDRLYGSEFLAPHDCYVRHRLAYERYVDQGAGETWVAQMHKRQFEAVRAYVVVGARFIVLHMVTQHKSSLPKTDLLQEGNFGVMEGLDHYNPDHIPRTSFPTYARFWIRQSLNRFRENFGKAVREPVHFQERRRRVNRFVQKHLAQYGVHPSDELIIEQAFPAESDADESEDGEHPNSDAQEGKSVVRRLKQLHDLYRYSGTQVSLSRPVNDDEHATTYENLVSDPGQMTPENYTFLSETYSVLDETWRRVQLSLRLMKSMHQTVLQHRLGIDDAPVLTLAALGEQFNLSRERIRQLERDAYILIGQRTGLSKEDVPLLFDARMRVAHLLGLPGGRAYDPAVTEYGWDFQGLEELLQRLRCAAREPLSLGEQRMQRQEVISLESKIEQIEQAELEQRAHDKSVQDEIGRRLLEKERAHAERRRQNFLELYRHWHPASSPFDPPLPWLLANRQAYPFKKRDNAP